MGIKQRDLDDGLTAAIAAMFALLPGLRAAFEAFVPPSDAPPNPPTDATRKLLADAEAFLARIRDAHAQRRTNELIKYPNGLEAAVLATSAWKDAVRNDPGRDAYRAFDDVIAFAMIVVRLRQAHQLIRQRGWDGIDDLALAWDTMARLTWGRADVLVVTGGSRHSEGVRRRAQETLEKMGKTGGWTVWTVESTATDARHAFRPHERGGGGYDAAIPAPVGLYADATWDEKSRRYVLPDELGHDTLPPLR